MKAEQTTGARGPIDPTALPAARRFTPDQLRALLEITSAVQCECPNHVAKLVEGLIAFEDYALDCENRNEEDAKIHALLYRSSGAARQVMEDALVALCTFEGIPLPAAGAPVAQRVGG